MSITNPKRGENKGIRASHRANKRVEAEARQAERDKRTDLEQAQLLVERRGHSLKETARLAERMEA